MNDDLQVYTYECLGHIERRIEKQCRIAKFCSQDKEKQRRLIRIVASLEEPASLYSSASASRTLFSLSRYGPGLYNSLKGLINPHDNYHTVTSFLQILQSTSLDPSTTFVLSLFGPQNFCQEIVEPSKQLFISTLGLPVSDVLIESFVDICTLHGKQAVAYHIVSCIEELIARLKAPSSLKEIYPDLLPLLSSIYSKVLTYCLLNIYERLPQNLNAPPERFLPFFSNLNTFPSVLDQSVICGYGHYGIIANALSQSRVSNYQSTPVVIFSSPPYAAHKLLHQDLGKLNQNHCALAVTAPFPFYHPLVLHQPYVNSNISKIRQGIRIQDMLYRKFRGPEFLLPSLEYTHSPTMANSIGIHFNGSNPFIVFAFRFPGFSTDDDSRSDILTPTKKHIDFINSLIRTLESAGLQVVVLGRYTDVGLGSNMTFKYNREIVKNEKAVLHLVKNCSLCISGDGGGLCTFSTFLSQSSLISNANNPWRADSLLSGNGSIVLSPSSRSPEELVEIWEKLYESKNSLEYQANIDMRIAQSLGDPQSSLQAHLYSIQEILPIFKGNGDSQKSQHSIQDSRKLGLSDRLKKIDIRAPIIFTQLGNLPYVKREN